MAEPTVAILGLGLIGGSLARDLAALGHRVLGFDRDEETLAAARAEGCIHGVLGDVPEGGALRRDPFAGIEDADIVVFAVPVGDAPSLLSRLAPRLRVSLVTDVGSTKRSIVAAAEAAGLGRRFVGSHPLAGDHRSGWPASRPGLFRQAPVFLCPARGAGEAALARAHALWLAVGGRPEVFAPEEHDARMAWVSHLPQAAAGALAAALAGSGYGAGALGPGGRDATRLAAGSPELWTDILLDNADRVGPALDMLGEELGRLRSALRRGDAAAVAATLARAKAWKDGARGA